MSCGNVGHTFHVSVGAGLVEKFGNHSGVHVGGDQIWTVGAAFAIEAVAFAAFVFEVAGFALGD